MSTLSTNDLKMLLSAANGLAKEIKTQNKLLQDASVLCLNQMERDSLSVLYAKRMLDLLNNLNAGVIPPLTRLVEKVDTDYKWLKKITEEP